MLAIAALAKPAEWAPRAAPSVSAAHSRAARHAFFYDPSSDTPKGPSSDHQRRRRLSYRSADGDAEARSSPTRTTERSPSASLEDWHTLARAWQSGSTRLAGSRPKAAAKLQQLWDATERRPRLLVLVPSGHEIGGNDGDRSPKQSRHRSPPYRAERVAAASQPDARAIARAGLCLASRCRLGQTLTR